MKASLKKAFNYLSRWLGVGVLEKIKAYSFAELGVGAELNNLKDKV